MYDQIDFDPVRPSHAVEMILDIAEYETGFIKFIQVIGDLGFIHARSACRIGARRGAGKDSCRAD